MKNTYLLNDVRRFVWGRRRDGCYWDKKGILKHNSDGSTKYSPLIDYPSLYVDFSKLADKKHDAVLAFAKDYGTLHVLEDTTFAFWQAASQEMNMACRLWAMGRAGKAESEKFLKFRAQGENTTAGWLFVENEVPIRFFPLRDDGFPPQYDPKGAALVMAAEIVNQELAGKVRPKVYYWRRKKTLHLRIVPIDLLGAMWLQLASAMDGQVQTKLCECCRRWFTVSWSPDIRNAKRKYCSNKCRQKAHRQRKPNKKD